MCGRRTRRSTAVRQCQEGLSTNRASSRTTTNGRPQPVARAVNASAASCSSRSGGAPAEIGSCSNRRSSRSSPSRRPCCRAAVGAAHRRAPTVPQDLRTLSAREVRARRRPTRRRARRRPATPSTSRCPPARRSPPRDPPPGGTGPAGLPTAPVAPHVRRTCSPPVECVRSTPVKYLREGIATGMSMAIRLHGDYRHVAGAHGGTDRLLCRGSPGLGWPSRRRSGRAWCGSRRPWPGPSDSQLSARAQR